MLPMVLAVESCKWNFLVSGAYFLDEFWPTYWSQIKMFNWKVVDIQKMVRFRFQYFSVGLFIFWETWIFYKKGRFKAYDQSINHFVLLDCFCIANIGSDIWHKLIYRPDIFWFFDKFASTIKIQLFEKYHCATWC